jgi:putative endonuclease
VIEIYVLSIGFVLVFVMSWFVYIVKCSDDTLYTGITNNIDKRMAKHNAGQASKYTRSRLPVVPVYVEDAIDRSTATKRELSLKKLTRRQKLSLISKQDAGD